MALRVDDVDLNRDSMLVERFQSGDTEAFDDLYRRYYARLVRFCLRRVGDPHEAEEVAQEAFVRAYRALPRLTGERRFYPWMTVIAGRLCVDSHRRRSRTEVADVIDLGTVEAELDDIFASVDHEFLAKAMAQLAPRHQEVLELREREGWSAQRIADHFGINVGTAEALLHRARRSLRREFLSITRDGGLLAGVPLLGALGRRYTAARNRLAAWAGQVGDFASPLAVKAASVMVAVGSTAVLGVGGGGAPLPVAATASPTFRTVVATSSMPTAATTMASAASSATSSTSNAPRVNRAGAAIGDASQGRAASSGAPIRKESAGTGASVDPNEINSQLQTTLEPIEKRLP